MKIKLDQNVPTGLVHLLTNLGHDVDTVPDEGMAGRDDTLAWRAAQDAGRFLQAAAGVRGLNWRSSRAVVATDTSMKERQEQLSAAGCDRPCVKNGARNCVQMAARGAPERVYRVAAATRNRHWLC